MVISVTFNPGNAYGKYSRVLKHPVYGSVILKFTWLRVESSGFQDTLNNHHDIQLAELFWLFWFGSMYLSIKKFCIFPQRRFMAFMVLM